MLRVHSFSISIDGYGAGPSQDLEHPLGVEDGETGVDDDIAARGFAGIGAWILGRNMFGPVRGPWPDDTGKAAGATSRCITRPSSC